MGIVLDLEVDLDLAKDTDPDLILDIYIWI